MAYASPRRQAPHRPWDPSPPLQERMLVEATYRSLLRLLLLPLALVICSVVGMQVDVSWRQYAPRRARELRDAKALEVAAELAAQPLAADEADDGAKVAADVRSLSAGSSLLRRLVGSQGGAPAWEGYASLLATRLAAAGCPSEELEAAKGWSQWPRVQRVPASSEARPMDACTAALAEALAAAALHREIAVSQVPPEGETCATARLLLLDYPWNGFASSFGVVAGALMSAVQQGRVLVLNEGTPWAHWGGADACGGALQQWECYFLPFGPCTLASTGLTSVEVEQAEPAQRSHGRRGPRITRMSQVERFAGLFYHKHLTTLQVPARYAAYGVGWWRAQHFLALWRLQPRVLRRVLRRARASGGVARMGDGFIAWHVRRGDKSTEGTFSRSGTAGRTTVFRPWQYGPELAALAAAHRTDAASVFLASDDAASLRDADALPLIAGGRLARHSLADTARLGHLSAAAAAVGKGHPRAAAVLAMDAISNIAILSQSRYSLALFHSNYARLATEFRHALGLAGDAHRFVDELECKRKRHVHIDRDSYFSANGTAWYLRLRRARAQLGLPLGFFVEGGQVVQPTPGQRPVG